MNYKYKVGDIVERDQRATLFEIVGYRSEYIGQNYYPSYHAVSLNRRFERRNAKPVVLYEAHINFRVDEAYINGLISNLEDLKEIL